MLRKKVEKIFNKTIYISPYHKINSGKVPGGFTIA